MSISKGSEGLYFPCDCVSGRQENYSEPWAAVAKNKLLPNGTKGRFSISSRRSRARFPNWRGN
jgi:hypothetical protein